VLEGIQQDQRAAARQPALDQERDTFPFLHHADRFGDRRRHQVRIGDLAKGDQEDPVRKRRQLPGRHFQRQPGFAYAARSGQRKQPNAWILQCGDHRVQVVRSAQKCCRRDVK